MEIPPSLAQPLITSRNPHDISHIRERIKADGKLWDAPSLSAPDDLSTVAINARRAARPGEMLFSRRSSSRYLLPPGTTKPAALKSRGLRVSGFLRRSLRPW